MKAYAKTNLILDLGEKNDQDRYDINFIMQEIDLADEVDVEPWEKKEIKIECNDPKVPLDERNLCYKAVKIMQELSGRTTGARINIEKNIPSAGGLGGGSADAAAVIKILNHAWDLYSEDSQLIEAVNPILGTDTSFFIKGNTAKVSQNGTKVESIDTNLKLTYLFVLPDIEVPENKTATIYKYFDPSKRDVEPNIEGMITSLLEDDMKSVSENLFNAFEYSLPPNYFRIPEIKRELIEKGCVNSIMCGAGPTLFGVCANIDEANWVAARLKDKHPLVFVASSR